jgi:pimeloyl-ACP methyl ester carboxylesterase
VTAIAEDVHITASPHVLAGTFTRVPEPVAAALLINGSGRVDRDGDALLPGGLKLRAGISRALAECLGAAGVSTLRYDKRGVGASGGDALHGGMADNLAEARAAANWLAERAGGLPLFAVGHSEGTYHAARLAADGQLAGAALLSGSVRSGEEVLTWQTAQLAAHLPASTRFVLRLLRTDVVRSQRRNLDRVLASTDDVLRLQGQRVNACWLREFAHYEPAGTLARVEVPVLAVTGGADLQVPPEDVEAIGRLVRGPFEGHVVDDLSHLLRPDPDRLGPRDYRRAVRQPVSPEVLALVCDWVAAHWGRPADRAETAAV